jgi:hypothetical protein
VLSTTMRYQISAFFAGPSYIEWTKASFAVREKSNFLRLSIIDLSSPSASTKLRSSFPKFESVGGFTCVDSLGRSMRKQV